MEFIMAALATDSQVFHFFPTDGLVVQVVNAKFFSLTTKRAGVSVMVQGFCSPGFPGRGAHIAVVVGRRFQVFESRKLLPNPG